MYKTGILDDPGLTERLYKSGAEFASDIENTMSLLLSILLTWILPLVLFIGVGQYMSKKMMERISGGKGSMTFGMGSSNVNGISRRKRGFILTMWRGRRGKGKFGRNRGLPA